MKALLAILPWLAAFVLAAILDVGSGKTYTTVGAAYDSGVAGDIIYVYPGTYEEKLTFSKDSITLMGSTYPSLDPSGNEIVITYSTYASAAGSDDASATLLVSGDNFKMYNMNITNSARTVGQVVALSIRGLYGGVYASALKSYQDTVYNHVGSQFFSGCYIKGVVGFTFEITGNAWYQGCTLGFLKAGTTITVQGRTSASTDGLFVFNEAKVIFGNGAASGTKEMMYLGRPWGLYAQVIFQNSNFENIIFGAGWQTWTSTQVTTNVYNVNTWTGTLNYTPI